MHSKKCCVIVTTSDDRGVLTSMAQKMVESKLAACIHLDHIQSFFYDEGECKQAEEFRLWIKAPDDNYQKIESFIKSQHNYQLPQIIKLDITAGLPEYLNWVHGN